MTVTSDEEVAHADPEAVLRELRAAAVGLDEAADELRKLMSRFEGYEQVDKTTGEVTFHPGAQLRWEELVGLKLNEIATRYEDAGKRPPAKEVLQVRADAAAKEADIALWADFHALSARIQNLQRWASSKRLSISARQSWLKAHGVITGFDR